MPNKSNEQKFDVLAVTNVQVFPFRGGPNCVLEKYQATIE